MTKCKINYIIDNERRIMKMEENKVVTTLKKNQTAEIPTKNGNKYSYQYIDIAQIHE